MIDTAGLRKAADPIEAEGIERAHRAARQADLIINLVGDHGEIEGDHSGLLVASKSDVRSDIPHGALAISATTGVGIDALQRAIVDRLGGALEGPQRVVITRARHHAALMRAASSLRQASEGFTHQAPPELIAVDVAEATDALAEIVGITTIEDVLDRLFGAFCIGK